MRFIDTYDAVYQKEQKVWRGPAFCGEAAFCLASGGREKLWMQICL